MIRLISFNLLFCVLQVVEALLERGVSLSQLDKYGRTPLMYAAYKHQPVKLGHLFIRKLKLIFYPGSDRLIGLEAVIT